MSSKVLQKQKAKRDKELKKLKNEPQSDQDSEVDDYDDEIDKNEEDPEEYQQRRKKDKRLAKSSNKRLHKEKYRSEALKFIDDAAEEDEDSENERIGGREGAYYDASQLQRKNQPLNLADIEDKYKQREEMDEDEDEELDGEDDQAMGFEADVVTQSLLPSTRDPKLWQVRVKKNFEKIAVMALLNKSIDFARRGQPLSILSVTSSDSTEGYIFVEAFKETHVKEACANLHFVFSQFILLPTEQMTSVYQNDKAKNNDIRPLQWIRVKQGGAYNQDIGLVEALQDNKVWIRIIPRIDPPGHVEKQKGKMPFRRVPQKLSLRPQQFGELAKQNADMHPVTKKNMWSVRNQLVYRGFVYKSFAFKQIEVGPNIKPTIEELQNFQACLQNSAVDEDDSIVDNEDAAVDKVIKQTLMEGGKTVYMKGDKISVNKGECTGMRGTVIEIEGGMVTFKPIDVPQLGLLQYDIAHVSKYFEPGDMVRITEGKYRGETGQVMDVDGNRVSMVLDQSQHEIRIFANLLKLKSDTDQLGGHQASLGAAGGTRHGYKAGDLVLYNGSKNAGLVLQVHEDYLKMINEQSKIVNIKIVDLGKKVPLPPRNGTLNGRDKNNNTLAMDQVVKVTQGPQRGLNGTIRHGYKHYIFLWNKEFVQSNGIFVQNARNTEILGAEFMQVSKSEGVANQNRLVKDPLVGKLVVIINGKFKGHRGRVTYADDKSAKVELSSQCKVIPIDKSFVKEVEQEGASGTNANADGRSAYGGQSMHGGATVYDGGKTGFGKNTPSYYPQSMWGGDNDNFETANEGGQQDFMRVPGSDHYPNQEFYPTSQAGGDFKREREH